MPPKAQTPMNAQVSIKLTYVNFGDVLHLFKSRLESQVASSLISVNA